MTTWEQWLNENTTSEATPLNERVVLDEAQEWQHGVLKKPVKGYNSANHSEIHNVPKGSLVTFRNKSSGGSMFSHNTKDGKVIVHHGVPQKAASYIEAHVMNERIVTKSTSGNTVIAHTKHDLNSSSHILSNHTDGVIKKGTEVVAYHFPETNTTDIHHYDKSSGKEHKSLNLKGHWSEHVE